MVFFSFGLTPRLPIEHVDLVADRVTRNATMPQAPGARE